MFVMSTKITKDNLSEILKDLGKEYRRRNGKTMRAEIVMVGGAAVLALTLTLKSFINTVNIFVHLLMY